MTRHASALFHAIRFWRRKTVAPAKQEEARARHAEYAAKHERAASAPPAFA